MRHVNWWYVGGAAATLVIAITLGQIWSFDSMGGVAGGWGAVIGIDIRDSRQQEREGKPHVPAPKWLNPLLALLGTATFLAIGLFLAVGMRALWGEPEFVTAPLTTGAVLAVLAIVGALALFHRHRRLRNRATD
jgi:hypothetical protein